MYLITIAPSIPSEKPQRVVCKAGELVETIMSVVSTPAVSFLVELVIDSGTYGKSVEAAVQA